MSGLVNLRSRVTVAMIVIAALNGLFLTAAIYITNESLEFTVLQQQVELEHERFINTLEHEHPDRVAAPPLTQSYAGVDNTSLPPEFRALEPGQWHNVAIDDRRFQVLVKVHDGEKIYTAYDITDWETRERYFEIILTLGLLLAPLLAWWLGRWASRQIMSPLSAFAERVKSLDPRERSVRMAQDFQDREINMIAEAFDRYMERLDGFVEREQSFTSAASHELRTPLTVIQGAADVLDEQEDMPVPAQRATRRIRRATVEMREFIDALLFLSREDHAQQFNVTECNVTELARDMANEYRAQLTNQAIDLSFEDGEQMRLEIPPSIMTLVISNLLRNAIEHTERGKIEISVQEASLVVSDTGKGIAQADLERLFDRDFTTKAGGGGMGLFLVKRICDRFGWDISVESVVDEGTEVRIRLGTTGTPTPA